MAKELINRGADVNQIHGSPDLNRGSTALIVAVDHQHPAIVQLLLDRGANINKTVSGKRSALQAACRNGDIDAVQLLINAGANVNYVSSDQKNSAMHWTLAKNHRYDAVPLTEETKAQIVRMLVEAGANRNAKDRNGNTAADLAGLGKLELVLEALQ